MGFSGKKKSNTKDTSISGDGKDTLNADVHKSLLKMYNPLSKLKWKDATPKEKKKLVIEAYSDLAF